MPLPPTLQAQANGLAKKILQEQETAKEAKAKIPGPCFTYCCHECGQKLGTHEIGAEPGQPKLNLDVLLKHSNWTCDFGHTSPPDIIMHDRGSEYSYDGEKSFLDHVEEVRQEWAETHSREFTPNDEQRRKFSDMRQQISAKLGLEWSDELQAYIGHETIEGEPDISDCIEWEDKTIQVDNARMPWLDEKGNPIRIARIKNQPETHDHVACCVQEAKIKCGFCTEEEAKVVLEERLVQAVKDGRDPEMLVAKSEEFLSERLDAAKIELGIKEELDSKLTEEARVLQEQAQAFQEKADFIRAELAKGEKK